MLLTASTVSQFAEGSGFIAATIAICGFLAHVPRALSGAEEVALRRATAGGGLIGFVLAVAIVVLSA
ncbi:MAG TPA: hypothetical protein VFY04_03040 [Solirubrobacterales bacterium]|nr:hypothetical protein [Solirubrobacterales bacterium]